MKLIYFCTDIQIKCNNINKDIYSFNKMNVEIKVIFVVRIIVRLKRIKLLGYLRLRLTDVVQGSQA